VRFFVPTILVAATLVSAARPDDTEKKYVVWYFAQFIKDKPGEWHRTKEVYDKDTAKAVADELAKKSAVKEVKVQLDSDPKPAAANSTDVTGTTWKLDGTGGSTVQFKADGSVVTSDGTSGRWRQVGEVVTWSVKDAFVLRYTGTIKDGKMTGTYTIGDGTKEYDFGAGKKEE
jgi:hypothetical protein